MNLASHLLLDAFKHDCDIAVIISNDSDLRVPIRIAEQELGVRVGVINPHPPEYWSRVLKGTFFKQRRPSALADCQLPATLADARGTIHKPAGW